MILNKHKISHLSLYDMTMLEKNQFLLIFLIFLSPKMAKISQNIDFQTLFLLWFWISLKLSFQQCITRLYLDNFKFSSLYDVIVTSRDLLGNYQKGTPAKNNKYTILYWFPLKKVWCTPGLDCCHISPVYMLKTMYWLHLHAFFFIRIHFIRISRLKFDGNLRIS